MDINLDANKNNHKNIRLLIINPNNKNEKKNMKFHILYLPSNNKNV